MRYLLLSLLMLIWALPSPSLAKGGGISHHVIGKIERIKIESASVQLTLKGNLQLERCEQAECTSVDIPIENARLRVLPAAEGFFGMFHTAERQWGGGSIKSGLNEFANILRANFDKKSVVMLELLEPEVFMKDGKVERITSKVYRLTDPTLE